MSELTTFGDVRGVLRQKSPWLAAEDLDGDLRVTIDHVEKHEEAQMEDGARTVVAVHFKDHPKAWVLNLTNADELKARFGRDVSAWKGKQVTLYAAKLSRPAFGRSHGLRLKDE